MLAFKQWKIIFKQKKMKNKFIESEIKRLKELLKCRQEDYKTFGCTEEDRDDDFKTRQKIKELEKDNSII